MHQQHIKRHGKGAGLILQTIKDNTNVATFADAETVEKSLKNISSTFFPRRRRAETKEHKMISKPDIIIFPELTQEQTHTAPEPAKKRAIFLEISFTGDGFTAQRFQQKLTQHTAHAQFLAKKQWTVEVVPIIITLRMHHRQPNKNAHRLGHQQRPSQKINFKITGARMHLKLHDHQDI